MLTSTPSKTVPLPSRSVSLQAPPGYARTQRCFPGWRTAGILAWWLLWAATSPEAAQAEAVKTLRLHGAGSGDHAPTYIAPSPSPSPRVVPSSGASSTSPASSASPASASSGSAADRYNQVFYGNEAYMAAYRRVIRSYNPKLPADDLESIVRSVLYYSYVFKIDPRFVVAVVACESAFRPRAVSGAGAGGLGQLMPETARELHVNAFVPYQNIQGTVRYLKLNLDRFKGRKELDQMRLALACYNAGYGAVLKYGGVPPYAETQNYVQVVMSEYTRLSGKR